MGLVETSEEQTNYLGRSQWRLNFVRKRLFGLASASAFTWVSARARASKDAITSETFGWAEWINLGIDLGRRPKIWFTSESSFRHFLTLGPKKISFHSVLLHSCWELWVLLLLLFKNQKGTWETLWAFFDKFLVSLLFSIFVCLFLWLTVISLSLTQCLSSYSFPSLSLWSLFLSLLL